MGTPRGGTELATEGCSPSQDQGLCPSPLPYPLLQSEPLCREGWPGCSYCLWSLACGTQMACLAEPGCYLVLQGHWQSGREQQAWHDSAAKDRDVVP